MAKSSLGDRWIEEELTDQDTDYRMNRESSILRWWHIPERRNVVVTIERVTKAKDKKVGKRQYALRFKGARLPYLTNATAEKTLARLFGNAPRSWVGGRITLYRTTTEYNGETVQCIRIRPQAPKADAREQLPDEKAAAPADAHMPEHDDEADELRARAAQARPNANDVAAAHGAGGGGEDWPSD